MLYNFQWSVQVIPESSTPLFGHMKLLYLYVTWRIFLEDPGVDGRIILKWTCERLDGGGHGLDQSGSG
jgi:hypothetical protein